MSTWSGPNFRNDLVADLVSSAGGDSSVAQAARVSVVGANERDEDRVVGESSVAKDAGLINYLVREKHGSPFEHNTFTFYVNAPIFVAREFMRHRIGWSYNEVSGRYSELKPDFYLPDRDRPLVNAGTSAKPELTAGSDWQYASVEKANLRVAKAAWEEYQWQLHAGVANEVARGVLPVALYTEFYATCNARSLMAFLALRSQDERAKFKSRPQLEIAQVAEKIEAHFAERFPLTYEAFNKNGRVAP